MNQIMVMGHAGRDAELRFTQNGLAMAKFSVAVSQGKDKPTDWFAVTVWREQAERVAEQVKKGDLVQVIGSMRSSKDKDEKTYWGITAQRVITFKRHEAEQQSIGEEVEYSSEEIPF
jgi:single-strand DNA-binding protein